MATSRRLFQTLKLFNTLNLIETLLLKETKYTVKSQKQAIKILTKPLYNKESRAKLKRKADEELVETLSSDQDYDSDSKTIQYTQPYRDTFTK